MSQKSHLARDPLAAFYPQFFSEEKAGVVERQARHDVVEWLYLCKYGAPVVKPARRLS